MSRLTEMLKQTYKGIKESIENAIAHVERQYESAKTTAEGIGAQSKYDPNNTWEDRLNTVTRNIPKKAYCRLHAALLIEYQSVSTRFDFLAMTINLGTAPQEMVQTYYRLEAFRDELKKGRRFVKCIMHFEN